MILYNLYCAYSQLKEKRPITHYNSKPNHAALQQELATFGAEWDSPVTTQRKMIAVASEEYNLCIAAYVQ